MRKLGITAAILTLSFLFQTAICFAGTLEIVDSYPRNGGKGYQPVNCAVKLYFNREITSEDLITNSERVTFKDAENNVIPVRMFLNPKDKTMVLAVVENDLQSNMEYTLTVSGEFALSNKDTLENDHVIKFKTRDVGSDTNAMMGLMIVMMVGMVIFTTRQAKKQAQKDAAEKERINPYKMAKETGKPVEEIIKKTEKERQRRAQEKARRKAPPKKKARKADGDEDEFDDVDYDRLDYELYRDDTVIRVKGPRPISAAGSKYRSGKKAKAEKAAAKKAKAAAAVKHTGTTRPKNQSGKAKNKKK